MYICLGMVGDYNAVGFNLKGSRVMDEEEGVRSGLVVNSLSPSLGKWAPAELWSGELREMENYAPFRPFAE